MTIDEYAGITGRVIARDGFEDFANCLLSAQVRDS